MSGKNDLTQGSVGKNLVLFALPYLLSSFMQTFYGMADLFVVGLYNGSETTTAVSIGSQVMHMLTVIIVGLAMGSTVLIGQAVGREDRRETAQVTGNTVTLFMVVSLAMTVVLGPLVGTAVGEIFWFFTYRLTVIPILVILPIFLALGALVPLWTYRSVARHTIVERLREAEG